ncbi:MAG: DUF4976 domain-containing protein [Planctomycetota bacterium]|nr:MAG: DUF4976 domain-containing protein [Planctomycetota bacterium]
MSPWIWLLPLLSLLHQAQTPDPAKPPNFVFILADDLGWGDLGCYGHPYHRTPALDGLAAEGMRFTQAYANAPNCAPSRACLQTGLYGPRHGIYTVGSSARGKSQNRRLIPTPNRTELPAQALTMAEFLARHGYTCASIGKWHLGPDPNLQGYRHSVAGYKAGHPPKGYFSPYHNPKLEDGPKGEYLTDRLAQEAIDFLEQQQDNPFFLYLPFYSVHTPIQAPKDRKQSYLALDPKPDRFHPTYAAMVSSLDQAVATVLSGLDRLGLRENTVVLFFSDNGGHGKFAHHGPLRGSKGMLYEGGLRVPFLIRWPGEIKPGTVCHEPILGTDMFPSLAELAGIAKTDWPALDGRSLVNQFRQDPERRAIRPLFWHFPAYLEAYAGMDGFWRTTPAAAIRKGRWKLIEFFEDGRLELYDLTRDPGEQQNLAAQNPEQVAQLLQEMRKWREATGAPVPAERNPDYRGEEEASEGSARKDSNRQSKAPSSSSAAGGPSTASKKG